MTSLKTAKGVALYTDGSSNHVDRSGGWAWVALDAHGTKVSGSGYYADTTNNQMELLAPVMGLNQLFLWYGPCEILVRSDSQYVVKGANDRSRARRANQHFWHLLDVAVDQHQLVRFEHVKGHQKNGSPHNALADKLAGSARREGVDRNDP